MAIVIPNVVPREMIQTVYQEVLQVIRQQHAVLVWCAQTETLKRIVRVDEAPAEEDVQVYLSTLRLLANTQCSSFDCITC